MDKKISATYVILGIIAIIIICYILYCIFKSNPEPKQIPSILPSKPQPHPQPQSHPIIPLKSGSRTKPKSEAEYTLYNFSDPRCPYAQQFKSVWDQLAHDLESVDNINTRYIDTSLPENDNLAFYYNVRSSPTVILATPTKHEEYEGPRRFELLKAFTLNKMIQP